MFKTFAQKKTAIKGEYSPDDVPHAYCVLGDSKWQSLGFAGQLCIKKYRKSNNYCVLSVMLIGAVVPKDTWIKETEMAWAIFFLPILTGTTHIQIHIDIYVVIHLIKGFIGFFVVANLMCRLHVI